MDVVGEENTKVINKIVFIDDTKKLKESNKKYKEENEENPIFEKITLDKVRKF